MDKGNGKRRNRYLLVLIACFILWFFLFYVQIIEFGSISGFQNVRLILKDYTQNLRLKNSAFFQSTNESDQSMQKNGAKRNTEIESDRVMEKNQVVNNRNDELVGNFDKNGVIRSKIEESGRIIDKSGDMVRRNKENVTTSEKNGGTSEINQELLDSLLKNDVTRSKNNETEPSSQEKNTASITNHGFESSLTMNISATPLEPEPNLHLQKNSTKTSTKGSQNSNSDLSLNKNYSNSNVEGERNIVDPCLGRYIYIHKLPSKFNKDMLKNCKTLNEWTDMCRFTSNSGMGRPLSNTKGVLSKNGWYSTNQFALDVIFHSRMNLYECLTLNSSAASAIFVPFYAGLDIGRYLWAMNSTLKDAASMELMDWLVKRPEWKRMQGGDHFMVAGRITWDFRRLSNSSLEWGNELLILPATKNMTVLVIESSPWSRVDVAVPYPTYFHPAKASDVFSWQKRMARIKRPWLFSFVGASRPNIKTSIRDQLIDQCQKSKLCYLLECNAPGNQCQSPSSVMRIFQSSVFCLQPQGDSYTRRSAFDSILGGCIPVFFHPGSAYTQYLWHLPLNYTKYSVFIPEDEVRDGVVDIEKRLLEINREQVRSLRDEVIGLTPRVIYGDPKGKLEKLKDAFDIAVEGVLKRVERVRRGLEGDQGFGVEQTWKQVLPEGSYEEDWDRFFKQFEFR
ncbi:xyloglucan galactosyltransferase KATAMARI1 homolog [Amborella trichopoda]|nr:xyloglucan galactosyltransferase KATAMARI1 homolog [Amborella trichopoda]|eukprot:XP_006846239.2 xyloglucan galactosyltransferase KATAMARI1 homolog [Amborella trichopoda]